MNPLAVFALPRCHVDTPRPLWCSAVIRRVDDRCTFKNDEIRIEVEPGELLWLKGPSGAGKTLTSLHILGIQKAAGVTAEVGFDAAPPPSPCS